MVFDALLHPPLLPVVQQNYTVPGLTLHPALLQEVGDVAMGLVGHQDHVEPLEQLRLFEHGDCLVVVAQGERQHRIQLEELAGGGEVG